MEGDNSDNFGVDSYVSVQPLEHSLLRFYHNGCYELAFKGFIM